MEACLLMQLFSIYINQPRNRFLAGFHTTRYAPVAVRQVRGLSESGAFGLLGKFPSGVHQGLMAFDAMLVGVYFWLILFMAEMLETFR